MALAMVEEAEKRGDLRPGMTVVEYTGGSTGSSLAFVCAVKGYRLRVVSSDAFGREKLDTMRALGAELTVSPPAQKGAPRETARRPDSAGPHRPGRGGIRVNGRPDQSSPVAAGPP